MNDRHQRLDPYYEKLLARVFPMVEKQILVAVGNWVSFFAFEITLNS